MRTFPSLSTLVGIIILAGPVARADTRPPVPTAASDAAATQAAIAALAKGPLHDLSGAVAKLNTRLDSLEADMKQTGQSLAEINLPEIVRREAATQAAAADLSARQDRLENSVASAHTRVAESAAAADTAILALKQELGNADARLRADQQSEADRIDGAVKALGAEISSAEVARNQAAARATAMQARAGLTVAGLIAALIVATVWFDWRGRLALQCELSLALARLGTEFRQVLAAVRTAPEAVVSAPDWNGLEMRLRHLIEWGENGSTPAPRSAAPASPPSEKSTVSVGALAEPAVASRLLWPADFLDPESPLSRWRFLLEGHLADAEHPALPVLTHLLNLRALLAATAAAPAEIAAALFRLSESLHAYWHSLTDLTAEDRQQASAAWLQSMRALAGSGPRLDVREIRPGARVDPDLMHAVIEGPGNHLNVADVFSWAVVDRAGDRFRVLHRALIAST